MKKLLTLIFIASCFYTANASHMAGGKIWYEYAGDATHPYRYDVYLELNRDVSGVSMGSYLPASICVTSSCYGQVNKSASLVPFILSPTSDTASGSYPGSIVSPGQTDCVNLFSPGAVITETYLLHCQVDLPGKCVDFTFGYSVSARNSSSNLVGAGNFHIETKLNNTNGPNSSPRFKNPLGKVFCINTPFIWSQEATEADGDSIYYSFGNPSDGTCGNSTPMAFNAGFSVSSPMTTVNGIYLDSLTGLLSFTPAQQEVDVIHIIATEYRYEPTLQLYYIVGSSEMDIQISIVANCRMETGRWVTDPKDTLGNIDPLLCGDSLLTISTQRKFLINSLAADGSDFALINSRGNLVPIVGAGIKTKGNSSIESSSFWLKLSAAISYNDTLTLISRVGNDLNTLINTCSNELLPGDSITLIVSSCATSIGTEEIGKDSKKLVVYPNPTAKALTVVLPPGISTAAIRLFDLSGKELLTKKIASGEEQLQMDFLPKGMYLLKVSSTQWSQTIKFEKL